MDQAGPVLGVIAFIGFYVLIGVAARRVTRPKQVRFRGRVEPTIAWFPDVLNAANKMSAMQWDITTHQLVDEEGRIVGWRGEIRHGEDQIDVHAPHVPEAREFTSDDPLTVSIDMVAYAYRRNPLWLLIAGKFPQNHVVNARGRVMKAVPRQIRKAAKQSTRGISKR